MADESEVPSAAIEVSDGCTVDPPSHKEEALRPKLHLLRSLPFNGEGTVAPCTKFSNRTLRKLEASRCPPLRKHVPPAWFNELIQGDCTPERLATEAARLLDDESARRRMREELLAVDETLTGKVPAAQRAAEVICEQMKWSGEPAAEPTNSLAVS